MSKKELVSSKRGFGASRPLRHMTKKLPRYDMFEWFLHHFLVRQQGPRHDVGFTRGSSSHPHFLEINTLKLLDFFDCPSKRIVQHTYVVRSSSIRSFGVVDGDDAPSNLLPIRRSRRQTVETLFPTTGVFGDCWPDMLAKLERENESREELFVVIF